MKKRICIVCLAVCISLAVSACGPSQADLDATATQVVEDYYATQTAAPTATPTATPTPTPTPTPIPGKFLNPPEYLETVFYPDWSWQTNPQGMRIALRMSLDMPFTPMVSYLGNRVVNVNALFSKEGELAEEIPGFIAYLPDILNNFISTGTQEQIYRFMAENTDLGKYDATIDQFAVVYEVKLFRGVTNLALTIWQM